MSCAKNPGTFFLSLKDQKSLYDVLYDAKKVLDKYNITFWAAEGTLLGALRHKGLIPWDDDVDIGMKLQDREKIQNIPVSAWESHNLVFAKHWLGFKIFRKNGKYVPNNEEFPYKYPFVDVFIFKKYKKKWGFVKDEKEAKWHHRCYTEWPDTVFNDSELFPLKLHNFDFPHGTRQIPVAQDSTGFLTRNYKGWETVAYTNSWNHKTEQTVKTVCKYPIEKVRQAENEFFNSKVGLLKDNKNAKHLKRYVDHVYIINLKHRKDRRTHIRQQMKYLGFKTSEFSFITATDRTWKSQQSGFEELGFNENQLPKKGFLSNGKISRVNSGEGKRSQHVLDRYGLIRKRISSKIDRNKGLAEVAVTLSHARIWKEIADHTSKKSRFLILEDDACISTTFPDSNFKDLITKSNRLYPSKELVLLGYCYPENTKSFKDLQGPHNYLETGQYYCMQSYIVTPRIAQLMLDNIFPIDNPVDELFQKKIIMDNAVVFHVPLFNQSPEEGATSDIQHQGDITGEMANTDSMKFGVCFKESPQRKNKNI
jgi:GR25 family glycosyltransferase involved in LPS biosynthesis